jgi:hypothetical protein
MAHLESKSHPEAELYGSGQPKPVMRPDHPETTVSAAPQPSLRTKPEVRDRPEAVPPG